LNPEVAPIKLIKMNSKNTLDERAMNSQEPPVRRLSALRYSMEHDLVLGSKYSRHRIFIDLACQGKRILELGCADGYISRHLNERGCRVTGVEIDAEAAGRARPWCEKVVVHDLNHPEWVQQVGDGFDTVLCGDVLEHLVQPEIILWQIHRVLAPGGRVIICLPNIAHIRIRLKLLFGKFEYASAGTMDVTHLRFYTYKTARELIEHSGFKIVSYHPLVGGGAPTRWLRVRLHKLFAGGIMFVAVPATGPDLTSGSRPLPTG
jgi:2-polyprenyl-3-methyl-5-hydroxy-6-metoxy-1,4-benzoquinol methylase